MYQGKVLVIIPEGNSAPVAVQITDALRAAILSPNPAGIATEMPKNAGEYHTSVCFSDTVAPGHS